MSGKAVGPGLKFMRLGRDGEELPKVMGVCVLSQRSLLGFVLTVRESLFRKETLPAVEGRGKPLSLSDSVCDETVEIIRVIEKRGEIHASMSG